MLLSLCINIAAVLHVNVTAAVYGWCHCHVQVVPLLQVNVSVMCMSICVMLLLLFVNMAVTANKCWRYCGYCVQMLLF